MATKKKKTVNYLSEFKEKMITSEQAFKLKDLGFNEGCSHYYNKRQLINRFSGYGYTSNGLFKNNQTKNKDIAAACSKDTAISWLIRNKIPICIIPISVKTDTWSYIIGDFSPEEFYEALEKQTMSYSEAINKALSEALLEIENRP